MSRIIFLWFQRQYISMHCELNDFTSTGWKNVLSNNIASHVQTILLLQMLTMRRGEWSREEREGGELGRKGGRDWGRERGDACVLLHIMEMFCPCGKVTSAIVLCLRSKKLACLCTNTNIMERECLLGYGFLKWLQPQGIKMVSIKITQSYIHVHKFKTYRILCKQWCISLVLSHGIGLHIYMYIYLYLPICLHISVCDKYKQVQAKYACMHEIKDWKSIFISTCLFL